MAVDVVLVLHPGAFGRAFKSAGGMVGTYISEVTEDVRTAARFEAPGPGKVPRNRSGMNFGKGRLQASIKSKVGLSGEVEGVVYTDVPYARFVLFGTAPHIIRAKVPGKHLRFFWWKKMAWVAFPQVNHPGQAANDFLGRALRKGLAVHGFF